VPIVSGLIAAGQAAVAGITAAFSAGGIFAAGTAGGIIARAALQVGLGVGLSALSRSTQRKSAAPQSATVATSQVEVGGDIPRQVAFGRIGVKGHLTHIWAHGAAGNPSNYLTQIHVLSDGWIGGLVAVWIAGKRYELRSLTPTHTELARYDTAEKPAPFFEIRFYDGRPGQGSPSAFLASLGITDFPSTSRGAGVAYAVTTLLNFNSYWSGAPDLVYEIDGYRCYDPRLDDTAGGSGPMRWDQPATFASTENPALHAYNYLRGIQCEGQVFIGPEVPGYDLPTDWYIAAANISDESVPLDGGGSEKRYRASLVISADETDHRSAIAPLVQAMAGALFERTGELLLVAGAAQAPVATITDDDIVVGAPFRWSASRPRDERANEVHGQFIDPAAGWQPNSYPAVKSASALAEDGERLAVPFDARAVTSQTQAQRVALIELRRSRRQRNADLTVARRLLRLEIGDWIQWNSAVAVRSGLYRIEDWSRQADDTTRLTLRGVDNAIYSWSTADEQPFQPPSGGTTPPAGISTVSGFVVQEDVAPGTGRPIAVASWTPITDERVKAVIIEYRPVGTVLATRLRDDSPLDGQFVIDQPATGANYEYRATIVTEPPRPTTWTGWVTLQIDNVGSVAIENLLADARALLQRQTDATTALRTRLNALAHATNESIVGRELKLIDLKEELQDAKAEITQTAELFAANDAAFAALTTTVTARLGSNTANVSSVMETLAQGDLFGAQSLLGTSATAGQVITTGTFDISSVADPTLGTGGTRFALKAKADAPGVSAVGAMFVEAWVVGGVGFSRVLFVADQFRVELPNGNPVMYYDPGTNRVVFQNVQIDGDLIRTAIGMNITNDAVSFVRGNYYAPQNNANEAEWVDASSTISIGNTGSTIIEVLVVAHGLYDIYAANVLGFLSDTSGDIRLVVGGVEEGIVSDSLPPTNSATGTEKSAQPWLISDVLYLRPGTNVSIKVQARWDTNGNPGFVSGFRVRDTSKLTIRRQAI
jgi:hypothetical protein